MSVEHVLSRATVHARDNQRPTIQVGGRPAYVTLITSEVMVGVTWHMTMTHAATMAQRKPNLKL